MTARTNVNKVVIIGVDGVSWDYLNELIGKGKLPAFKKLVEEGSASPFESSIPPTTPVAWSCSYTGKNPGKTGLYGFFKRLKGRYSWFGVNADNRMSRDVWEIAGDSGKRSIVIGMPFTYPVRKMNGIMLGCHFTTDVKKAIYPPEIAPEVVDGIKYEFACHDGRNIESLALSVEKRLVSALDIARTREWDLLCIGIEQLEQAHHVFMNVDLSIIEPLYERADKALNKFMHNIGEVSCVIIYSDHGHKTYRKAFCIDAWLAEAGYLSFKSGEAIKEGLRAKLGEELAEIDRSSGSAIAGMSRKTVFLAMRWAMENAPWLKRLAPFLRPMKGAKRDETYLSDDMIYDFARTTAFPYIDIAGNFGGIYINLSGREPGGIVSSGAYEDTRDEIIAKLKAATDPKSGKHVIKNAWKKEEIYKGEYLPEMPDIVIELDVEYMPSLNRGLRRPQVFENALFSHHERKGIFLSRGRSIKRSGKLRIPAIQDIAPTILYAMGLAVPSDMDGRPLEEIFTDEFRASNKVRYSEASGAIKDERAVPDEQAKIMDRLKNLGYLD
jgi:predicted AlkP superfamily phosphohydrolase/phosphomutase